MTTKKKTRNNNKKPIQNETKNPTQTIEMFGC